MLVDLDGKAVDGVAAGAAASADPGDVPTAKPKISASVDEYAHEGAFFGTMVVNLPNGKPMKAGGVDVVFHHRFVEDIQGCRPERLIRIR